MCLNSTFLGNSTSVSPAAPWSLVLLLATISSVIIFLNVFSIVILLVHIKRHVSLTNFHVISLALTDILVGASLIPNIDSFVNNDHTYAYADCLFRYLFFGTSFLASMSHTLGICSERVLIVRKAIQRRSSHAASFTVFFSWTFSAIAIGIIFIFWSTKSEKCGCTLEELFQDNLVIVLAYTGILYGVVQTLVLLCMFSIYTYIRNHSRIMAINGVISSSQSDLRICRTIICIAVVFTVFNLPMTVIILLEGFSPNIHLTKTIRNSTLIFAAMNSIANPVIYLFRIKEFRLSLQEFRKSIRKYFQKEGQSTEVIELS